MIFGIIQFVLSSWTVLHTVDVCTTKPDCWCAVSSVFSDIQSEHLIIKSSLKVNVYIFHSL